jgi:hypothetical protein
MENGEESSEIRSYESLRMAESTTELHLSNG